jgi:hypothetical protein
MKVIYIKMIVLLYLLCYNHMINHRELPCRNNNDISGHDGRFVDEVKDIETFSNLHKQHKLLNLLLSDSVSLLQKISEIRKNEHKEHYEFLSDSQKGIFVNTDFCETDFL